MALDTADAVREHQIQLALRTGELPFPQGADHDRRQRNGPPAGRALQRPHGVEAVGTLTDAQLGLLQVDVSPAQTTQLGSPQPGEDRGQEEGPPAPLQMAQDRADFVWAWDINADLERAAPPPLCLVVLLAGEAMDDVLGDESARMAPRSPITRLIMAGDRLSARSRSMNSRTAGTVRSGELHRADVGDDVVIEVLAVGFHGRALEPAIHILEPLLAGRRDRHPGMSVDAAGNVDADSGLIGSRRRACIEVVRAASSD